VMGLRRWIALVAVLVVALAAVARASHGGRGSHPLAHIACGQAATQCSEAGSVNLPPNSVGSQSTDVVPTKATAASAFMEPLNANELSGFDATWATVVDSFPKFANIKSTTVRRVITCAVMARAAAYLLQGAYDSQMEGDVRAANAYAAYLSVCVQMTVLAQKAAGVAARTAAASPSAVCAQANVSVTVMVSRTGSGYRATLVGRTSKASGRTPLTVSCRPKGAGMLVSLRPRANRRRLGQLVGPHLSLGFSNPTNRSVGIRTRFTFR
jgi:hypothetical protein